MLFNWKGWLLSAIIGLNVGFGYAQEPAKPTTYELIIPKKTVKLASPDSEVTDAIYFLTNKVKPQDQPFIRFFTTYAIPPENRQKAVLSLSFLLHSTIGVTTDEATAGGFYPLAKMEPVDNSKDAAKVFIPYRNVPDSDTLWWIDIREFNWSEETWELVSQEDGYFVEPIVDHGKNGLLRLIAGNAIVRADWFLLHASDTTQQKDVGSKVRIYRELLYSPLKNPPKDFPVQAPPKNVREFELTWGIDTEKARKIGNVSAALVSESQNVSRHNRILFDYRTELGWYDRSYDVNHMRGKRYYGYSILLDKGNPPSVFDGGEIFATNSLRMQVYDLYNAQEELADFGDPTLVRHMSDILGDARVRTASSCIDCHAAGPIPPQNTIADFVKARGDVILKEKEDINRLTRVYLSGKFDEAVQENQIAFTKALDKLNGLVPEENAKAFLDITSWYSKSLDLKQMALECGVTEQMFKDKMGELNKIDPYRVPPAIAFYLTHKHPVPRVVWESPGADGIPGEFQQAMIIIHGLTKVVTVETKNTTGVIEALYDGTYHIGNSIIGNYKKGEQFIVTGREVNGWIEVKYNNSTAFVQGTNVTKK